MRPGEKAVDDIRGRRKCEVGGWFRVGKYRF